MIAPIVSSKLREGQVILLKQQKILRRDTMGYLPKEYINISPESKTDREHTATARVSSDKEEIVIEFQAKVTLEISAYQELVKDDFKFFWITKNPGITSVKNKMKHYSITF